MSAARINYAAVPTSPRSNMSKRKQPQYALNNPPTFQHQPPRGSRQSAQGRGETARGVATGQIGAGYGPYSVGREHYLAWLTLQYTANPQRDTGVYNNARFSSAASDRSSSSADRAPVSNAPPTIISNAPTATIPQYIWDKEPDWDDGLHDPNPLRDRYTGYLRNIFSIRGWINAIALLAIVVGLLTLFIGYPIILGLNHPQAAITGFNLGGINGSGQIPGFSGLPRLIDRDTPTSAYTRTGSDGKKYNLVFSDEFTIDGRTFYPGDDPYWEAVDLHYWPTGDLEWYDPGAITTENGKLVITVSEQSNHGLNFMSGMLTTWNKLCFTTGYVEVSISLPGSPQAPGLWPAAWTMGNLGRAGYGATTEGMWPYSYDSCDLGTFPNQTSHDGTPAAAATGGSGGGPLSYLPGQRLSACTCPGSDHPGPSTSTGRGVPEIDILEGQVDVSIFQGQASQSYQMAPYNLHYEYNTAGATVYDTDTTRLNNYKGGLWQQAVSALTYVNNQNYNDQGYAQYGFEWWSNPNNRDEGYITWYANGAETWTLTAAAIGPDSQSQVSGRLISEEPMYLILNLGMAPGFQKQDYKHLVFPSKMYIDYVRIYQRQGVKVVDSLTCNPRNRPTADYIMRHMNAYTNPNLTTWEQAGYNFPLNSQYNGC